MEGVIQQEEEEVLGLVGQLPLELRYGCIGFEEWRSGGVEEWKSGRVKESKSQRVEES